MAEVKAPFAIKPLPIPRNFQRIEPAALADLLQKKETNMVVFDVRDVDRTGGRTNVPYCVCLTYR